MIVGWKSVNMDEFQATWQGMLLTLAKAAGKWRLWIYAQSDGDTLVVNNLPGAAVKGAWTEPRAAMEAVDTAMNRVLKKKMAMAPLAAVKSSTHRTPNFAEVEQARDRSKRDGNKPATVIVLTTSTTGHDMIQALKRKAEVHYA